RSSCSSQARNAASHLSLYSYFSDPTACPLGTYAHITRIASTPVPTLAAITRFCSSAKPGIPEATDEAAFRARIATPLYVFWPDHAHRSPAASSSRAGNLSLSTLVSCRQTTSGFFDSSHASSCGRRTLREFTFHDAIFIAVAWNGFDLVRGGGGGGGPRRG